MTGNTHEDRVALCHDIISILLREDPSLFDDLMCGCQSLYEKRQQWLSFCYAVFRIVCSGEARDGGRG